MAKWMLKQSAVDCRKLAAELNLDPVLTRVLTVRGLRSAAQINSFIAAEPPKPADPLLFADMEAALEVTAAALENQAPCAIFGDYDADGVMSTVIMMRTLAALGNPAQYYIPSRVQEGYGLNNEAITTLAAEGVELIFACDNGISAHEQVEYAAELGISVIIIDHHAVTMEAVDGRDQQSLPPADAVIDPKRVDCPYPFKSYCAAALCYRFSEALFQWLGEDWQALGQELLPFATIASVCDIVELTGENRALVKRGLPTLATADNPGIRALLAAVQLENTQLDTYHVGFILGPCINACGRLGIADVAVELFLTADPQKAAELAAQLVAMNQTRRALTEDGYVAALASVEAENLLVDRVLVIQKESIAESVAGIIAGRVKEKYNRPTVVLGGEGETLHGSCRSIEGYDIFQALRGCKDLLLSYGGHTLAAGLSLRTADVPAFRRQINSACTLAADDLQTTYRIDCALPIQRADLRLARALRCIEPIGKGNELPLFGDKGLILERLAVLGKGEKVLRWYLRQPSGAEFEAIDFHGKERLQDYISRTWSETVWQELLAGTNHTVIQLDILYYLSVNQYNNHESARLQIVDFRPAQRG